MPSLGCKCFCIDLFIICIIICILHDFTRKGVIHLVFMHGSGGGFTQMHMLAYGWSADNVYTHRRGGWGEASIIICLYWSSNEPQFSFFQLSDKYYRPYKENQDRGRVVTCMPRYLWLLLFTISCESDTVWRLPHALHIDRSLGFGRGFPSACMQVGGV